MNRRSSVFLLAILAFLGLLGAAPAAEAQPSGRPYRIGFLSIAAGPGLYSQNFLEGLRDLGYVEGQNFIMEYRWAALKNERLPELASDLVRAKVDVIVTGGTPATLAAQRATQTIPIVFASMGDPVARGVVNSLAHPGKNATGLALVGGITRVLQQLKDMAPKVSRVGFFYDPSVWAAQPLEGPRERLNAAVKPLGMSVQWVPVRDENDVERAFTLLDKGTDGLLLEDTASIWVALQRICGLALQRKLPAVGSAGGFADAGCLMGYGRNVAHMHRRAAAFVDKILKGAKPADLAVELTEKFDLVVNLDTARALGLAVAPALLAQATRTVKAATGSQQVAKVHKMGLLTLADRSDPRYGPIFDSALRERGYEWGRNLAPVLRFAAGKSERLPEFAADLVRQNVDIIVALGSTEALAAVKATTTIPIVFISPAPVELGIVRSLARPGGNATGVSTDVGPGPVGKAFELLKEMAPRLSRLALVWNPDRPEDRIYEKSVREAGTKLRLETRFLDVRGDRDLEAAFATIARERSNALAIGLDPGSLPSRTRITNLALKNGLPTVTLERAFVDDGGLMSYGPSAGELFTVAASYIDKILRGAKPADLPVAQPTKFELIINLKTAKALGLTIPQSVLVRADEVIQ